MKLLDPQSPAARQLASGQYVIRQADATVLDKVHIPWMREAGWNPGRHDCETYICADPQGFLVGELDGQPIACVSGVRYDDSFGFMGCYLVQEAFRGRGYGMAIHEAARARLKGCTQGGDGVLANVEKYKQIGRAYAYRNARYEGRKQTTDWRRGAAVVDLPEVNLSLIEELDRACFPAPRRSFLAAWINQPEAHGLAIAEPDGRPSLRGYGVIRQCFMGWKIGPLFARDPETAEAIFCGLIERIPTGDAFVLDVAEPNCKALDWSGATACRKYLLPPECTPGRFPK